MRQNEKRKEFLIFLRRAGFGLAFAALLVCGFIGLALYGMFVWGFVLFDYSLGLVPVGILGFVMGFVIGPKIWPGKTN
jgi:hypothetical protein